MVGRDRVAAMIGMLWSLMERMMIVEEEEVEVEGRTI